MLHWVARQLLMIVKNDIVYYPVNEQVRKRGVQDQKAELSRETACDLRSELWHMLSAAYMQSSQHNFITHFS